MVTHSIVWYKNQSGVDCSVRGPSCLRSTAMFLDGESICWQCFYTKLTDGTLTLVSNINGAAKDDDVPFGDRIEASW